MPDDACSAGRLPTRGGDRRVAAALAADLPGLRRLVTRLVAEEIGRIRKRPVPPAEWRGWGPDAALTDDSLGVDSLARLEIITRLDQMFALSETGVEDYLFVQPGLADWTRLIAHALAEAPRPGPLVLSFQTSGSTGAPKVVRHRLDDLAAELAAQAAVLPPLRRVIALTPPHHIYGFLFTVLAPALWDLPVCDLAGLPPGRALAEAQDGDLLVATPFQWDLMLRSGGTFRPGVCGLTSTAPAPADLWDRLAAAGLADLVEIFGASETAGLGTRRSAAAPFDLLAHLDRQGDAVTRDGAPLAVQDHLDWIGPRSFRPCGRADGAVQVGGVNVFCARVRSVLLAHPAVADCAVRLDGAGPGARLKAFVVPDPAAAPQEDLAAVLAAHAVATLAPPERPMVWTFGPSLPVTEMGKPADWPV